MSTSILTARARLSDWVANGGTRKARVHSRAIASFDVGGVALLWYAEAQTEHLGFTVDVESGPHASPDEACEGVIAQLVDMGYDVP